MLFNFLVWRKILAIIVFESLVYTIIFDTTSTMRISRQIFIANCCSSQFLCVCVCADLLFIAVVYLKNRINRGWAPSEDTSNYKKIPEEERPALRDRLIPILAASPPNVRAQFIPLITKILSYDFPEKWPGYMDITLQLLNANDVNSVFSGLQCLLAICKVYRFKANEKRGDFDKIVEHCFPQLLNIGNRLVDEESLEAAEMLHTVVKAYKHAIYVSLSLL